MQEDQVSRPAEDHDALYGQDQCDRDQGNDVHFHLIVLFLPMLPGKGRIGGCAGQAFADGKWNRSWVHATRANTRNDSVTVRNNQAG